jgi:hypothetical protein
MRLRALGPSRRLEETVGMSDEIEQAIKQWAPELNPKDVRAFMDEHQQPADEPDSHAVWAVKVLRQRGEGQHGDGAPLDTITDAMRNHDESQRGGS